MGQRPDQIETEMEDLRHETDLILDELSRRTNPQNILQAASSRVAGRAVIHQRSEPNMLKRALWIALASGMAALGSMLFRRITAQLWQSAMHEEPPRR